MTSDGPHLLKTILDNPDDDAPRGIYADWLEDPETAPEFQDPERAEFIRIQLELHRWDPTGRSTFTIELPSHQKMVFAPNGLDLAAMRHRELELMDGENSTFHNPFGKKSSITWCNRNIGVQTSTYAIGCHFSRGFVEKIECTHAQAETCLDEFLKVQPVRTLKITDEPQIIFGPLTVTSQPVYRQSILKIVHSWEEYIGPISAPRRMFRERKVTDLERLSGQHAVQTERDFLKQTQAARTVEGYFTFRWPGVRVEIPQRSEPIVESSAGFTHSGIMVPPFSTGSV